MLVMVTYLFQNFDIWFKFWILALIIIIAASFRKWEFSWSHGTLGSVILYIMIYPIFKEWHKYLNGILLEKSVLIFISIFIIIILLIFLILLLNQLSLKMLSFLLEKRVLKETLIENKILFKFAELKNKSKMRQWLENFFIICSTWISTLGHIPFATNLVNVVLYFFCTYLNTDQKKKYFFFLLLFLPNVIFLFATFYDIFIEEKIYWFPKVSFLILLSLVTIMLFLFVEKATNKLFDDINMVVYFGRDELVSSKEQQSFREEFQNFDAKYRKKTIELRKHLEGYISQENYDKWVEIFIFYNDGKYWYQKTRENIFNDFLPKKFTYFLILEIILQIIIITNA